MSVISTKYFDIIFSEESVETATKISENADELYLKAKDTICAKNEIRIVVVISPDSEVFSATYSPNPYNRIVIYDAPADVLNYKYDNYEDLLLKSFYHEVLKAVSQSIRNPFIDTVSKVLAVDALQPVYLLNLPFSFVEGIASLEDENQDILNDAENLKILIQAKRDGNILSWIDAAGSRDIYPGDELSKVVGIAFAAYLQQRYGLEKYIELWQESGNVYFIFYTKGIFQKVYGESLESVWRDFVDSIPIDGDENFNEEKFITTPYGLVLYDDIKNEVTLYDFSGDAKSRRLLFFIDGVTGLTVDESGRFITVTFIQSKMRENLHEYKTMIYDLEERSFTSEKYDSSDDDEDDGIDEESTDDEGESFNRNDYKKYNPLKYMFHGTWIPMLPVRDFKTETENIQTEYWPGLGVAYATQSDPLDNNELLLSVSSGFAKLDFTNTINPTDETLEKDKSKESEFTNDYTGVVFFKNTTLPINLSAGGIFKFTKEGQYNLKMIAEMSCTIPIILPFQKLNFNVLSVYKNATKYSGIIASEEKSDLEGWTGLDNSYKTYEISIAAKFSNVHQGGLSPYQKRGIEAQIKVYSLWDFTEIATREPEADTTQTETSDNNSNNGTTTNLLRPGSNTARNNTSAAPSLISFSIYAKLFFPRINPLPNYDGWILGVPTNISVSVLKDKGTAFSASSEIMVIGKEIQYGISFLNLYLTRFGLTLGYYLDFDYAVKKDLLPDIRSYKEFTDVFANTVLNDKISVGVDFVFSPVIGVLSRIGMNAGFNFIYGIQTKEAKISFDMKFRL